MSPDRPPEGARTAPREREATSVSAPATAAPATCTPLAMRLELHAAPYDGRLFKATTPLLRLSNEHDFAACQQLRATPPQTRYHVAYAEKYRLLEGILSLAREELDPLERVLLTSKMPSAVRFTNGLLAEDVFMCHDPAAELGRMQRRGLHVLVVYDRLVRHPLEYGDNTLELKWSGPRVSPTRFEALRLRLLATPFPRPAEAV